MRWYRYVTSAARRQARAVLVIGAVAALGACNTTPEADSIGGQILRGTAEPAKSIDLVELAQPRDCPRVEIRDGTQTLAIFKRGQEDDPKGLVYQATINRTARECRVTGGVLTMKVGVAGRALIGPQGGGSAVTLPVRIAVVRNNGEAPYSKLHGVATSISAANPTADFAIVDDQITLGSPDTLGQYTVYVGFDTKKGGK